MNDELGPNQRRWIKALRSGRYKQGKSYLRTATDEHCCLGVGCRIFRLPSSRGKHGCYRYGGCVGQAPPELIELLALDGGSAFLRSPLRSNGAQCLSLVTANDLGVSFAEIADFCEANPRAVFTEPR